MTIFILPTHGAKTYRGKYPFRARSIGGSSRTGRHVELNNGIRLWSCDEGIAQDLRTDISEAFDRAIPMTDAQYDILKEAASLLRERVNIAGHERRRRLEDQVYAILKTVQPVETFPVEQDGADFYFGDSSRGTVEEGIVLAPFDVKDGDVEAAKRAREWFVGVWCKERGVTAEFVDNAPAISLDNMHVETSHDHAAEMEAEAADYIEPITQSGLVSIRDALAALMDAITPPRNAEEREAMDKAKTAYALLKGGA